VPNYNCECWFLGSAVRRTLVGEFAKRLGSGKYAAREWSSDSFLSDLEYCRRDWRLGLFSALGGSWGRIDRRIFHELFAFARDIFLMSVGAQLLSASQVIIIKPGYGIGGRGYMGDLLQNFYARPAGSGASLEATAGGFTEMFVRGEGERLKSRLGEVVTLTASLSVGSRSL